MKRSRLLLQDESGQAIAFLVLAVPVLVGILALVVDGGGWFRAKQRAQSAADAAALAGAKNLADQDPPRSPLLAKNAAFANAAANGVPISVNADPSTVEVTAQPDDNVDVLPVPGVISPTITAFARAHIQVPTSIDAVAPVGVRCQGAPLTCIAWAPRQQAQFQFVAGRPDLSTLAPIQMNGMDPTSPLAEFRKYVRCDAQNPGDAATCNQTTVSPGYYMALGLTGRNVRGALRNGGSSEHLIPVFNDYSTSTGYAVVGWAVGTFSVHFGGGGTATVDVTFGRILVDGSFVDPSGSGGIDFGVRAVALSG
jgi:Flp pilus assembly protein TadG